MARSTSRLLKDIQNAIFTKRNSTASYKHVPLPNEQQLKIVLMTLAEIEGKMFVDYLEELDVKVPGVSHEHQ